MKTAMQELIERLKINIEEMPNEKNQFTQGYKAGLSFVIECSTNLLVKEKEQIIEANRQGRCNDCPIMYTTLEAQEYYNQTYNQNK